jgi:hypothetical protein
MVSYFNKNKFNISTSFCTTDINIELIIKKIFLSIGITLPSTSDLSTSHEKSPFAQSIRKLEHDTRSERILFIVEQRRIRLFGLADTVKELQTKIEASKAACESSTVNLQLSPDQVESNF